METIKEVFAVIGEVIDIIGIIILLYGFAKVLLAYLWTEFIKKPFKTSVRSIQKIRCEIVIYILLALDF